MTYKPALAAESMAEHAVYLQREFDKIAAELGLITKRLDQMAQKVEALGKVPPPPPVEEPPSADVLWTWDAKTVAPFGIHAKDPSRVTLVNVGGRPGVRLLTMPGDSNLFGSGNAERCDLRLSNSDTDATEGKKHWWSHNLWLPDDYLDQPESTASSWNWCVVMNLHNSADKGGQANAQLMVMPETAISPDRPIGLHFQISGGNPASPTMGQYPIGPIVRNAWLEFKYEAFWTSTPAGYFNGWLNGKQFMAHKGPTLYTGEVAYWKSSNYHTAHGERSAVIHGRIVRGATAASVTSTQLQ